MHSDGKFRINVVATAALHTLPHHLILWNEKKEPIFLVKVEWVLIFIIIIIIWILSCTKFMHTLFVVFVWCVRFFGVSFLFTWKKENANKLSCTCAVDRLVHSYTWKEIERQRQQLRQQMNSKQMLKVCATIITVNPCSFQLYVC